MDLLQDDLFQGELFKGIEYMEEVFSSKEFEHCRFENCNFTSSRFDQCFFEDCVFENCNLSMIRVTNSSFRGVSFIGSKMIGVLWYESRHKAPDLRIICKDSVLNYSSFFGIDLRKCSFSDVMAVEVDFTEANLSKLVLQGAKLSGATFFHTDLRCTDFSLASGYLFNPADSQVKGAIFTLPEAINLLYSFGLKII